MSSPFRQAVRRALADPVLQEALDHNAARRRAGAQRANATLPDLVAVRQRARGIRQALLQDWDSMQAGFAEACQANGLILLTAASAQEACDHVVRIAHTHGVRLVAKAKSMVSEEIRLNPALEAAGLRVVETDLGEFIVQLRGEAPSHIITPALHLRRQEVGLTFAEHLGIPYTEDVSAMTNAARRTLRQVFLTAGMGISGVNLAAADTGTLCLVTNEGNGRMVTTLPPVHVALMGIERLVPTIRDLAVILQLLPRNATGQLLTSYVTLIQGPGRQGLEDGPQHRYVVLVDNGRRGMLGTPLAEALMCIRCGACLNACPVFQEAGGHAYASPYPGPIGSVVSPGLFGIEAFGHLAKASTLCGACQEVCPIGIDIPRMLLHTRQAYTSAGGGRLEYRWGLRAFGWAATRPSFFAFGQRLASAASSLVTRAPGWMKWLPPPASAWTWSRHFPPFASRPFRQRLSKNHEVEGVRTSGHPVERSMVVEASPTIMRAKPAEDLTQRFSQALTAVSGEVLEIPTDQIADTLDRLLSAERGPGLCARANEADDEWIGQLKQAGFELLESQWPDPPDLRLAEQATWGIVQAQAGIADTGTVVVASHPAGASIASLLPPTLVIILRRRNLYADLDSWLGAAGKLLLRESPQVVLITGPSRTSDIEMTMTLGVHGPGRLIVLVIP